METVTDFIFLGSKITPDGDCSREIKRHLLLGRKAIRNLDSILKSRDMTLPAKVYIVKAMAFPVVTYGCDKVKVAKLCLTLCDPMGCSTSGFPVLHYLPEFAQTLSIVLVMPSNYLILCHPLLLLPSIFPSIRVFPMSWFFTSGG